MKMVLNDAVLSIGKFHCITVVRGYSLNEEHPSTLALYAGVWILYGNSLQAICLGHSLRTIFSGILFKAYSLQ